MNTAKHVLAAAIVASLALGACSKKTTTSDVGATRTKNNQERKPSGGPSFDALLVKMDTNKDGKLAQAEVQGPLKNDFSTIDSNKDGFISKEEFSNAPRVQGRRPPGGGQRPPR